MELQELSFRIEFRPDRENLVADYLSRNPGVSYDDTVNQEDNFEDRIYTVEKEKRLFERIAMEQKEDGVIARALTELSRKGRVMSGQLKNVSDRLKCIEGNLFFEDRIVTPKHLRQETTEVTHAQHHFGQTSTLRTLRKNFFWPKMRRDVIRCCRGLSKSKIQDLWSRTPVHNVYR